MPILDHLPLELDERIDAVEDGCEGDEHSACPMKPQVGLPAVLEVPVGGDLVQANQRPNGPHSVAVQQKPGETCRCHI